MKTRSMVVIGVSGILAISTVSCATAFAARPDWAGKQVNTTSATTFNLTQSHVDTTDATTLQFMVEEEKLAHDVYTVLYEKWGTPVFSSIANSETNHESKVANLLSQYGIDNPASSELGLFTNQELQNLYNTLIEKGMQSEKDALEVGVMIEKEDIQDLQTAIDATNNTKIERVFNNLLAASNKHLQYFESLL